MDKKCRDCKKTYDAISPWQQLCDTCNKYARKRELLLSRERNRKNNHKRYYRMRYNKDYRDKKKIDSKLWYQKNKKKQSLNNLRNYRNNKNLWLSRGNTRRILKSKKWLNILKSQCYECNNNQDLQIHHEIYPTLTLDIVNAIKSKKIYYLCKDCHSKRRVKKNPYL